MPAPSCQADPNLKRQEIDGFAFPLGVYPVEPMTPRAGYTSTFEPADRGENAGAEGDGEFEEWPDRYVFDIVAPATRVRALTRSLLTLLPLRVFPILDVLGNDAFREIDPFVSYEPLGWDRFVDTLRQFKDFFWEDGLVGFGAMSEEPFGYVFVDEHKIVTVRVEPRMKERVEKILDAFDLKEVEQPAGADAVAHEHRGVLVTPEGRPELLSAPEIVERLRDSWRLALNVDPDRNTDETGKDLGTTAWRCVVRFDLDDGRPSAYGEVLLAADSLRSAEDAAIEAVEGLPDAQKYLRAAVNDTREEPNGQMGWTEAIPVATDRIRVEELTDLIRANGKGKKAGTPVRLESGRVYMARWLGPSESAPA
jgi:hypothetical protein